MAEISKKFTTQFYQAIYEVDEDQDGMRLDQYCAHFLISFSRQQIKKKIAAGEVKIKNRPFPHKPSVKVYHKEQIEFITHRGDLEDEYWRGQKLELELDPKVIFEDDNIICITKPAYMTTHPTGKHLFNCATVYFEQVHGHTIHSIHRLDRETSGVLLLGKNPKAAGMCSDFFEKDLVQKCYFLIAHKAKNLQFPITANQRLGSDDNFIPRLYVHCYDENSSQGKHAQTSFDLVHEQDDYILALAYPKTGRQHQIRAHAAFHGFPLLGDKLYNGDPTIFMRFKDGIATEDDHDRMEISRHALHAISLYLPYPKGKNSLLKAPLPQDLRIWIEKKMPKLDIKVIEGKIEKKIQRFFNINE